MTLWQEHIPKPQFLGLVLQFINNARIVVPPLSAIAQLGSKNLENQVIFEGVQGEWKD